MAFDIDETTRQSLTEEVIENVLRQASLVSMDDPGAWLLGLSVTHLRSAQGYSLRQSLKLALEALRSAYEMTPEQGAEFMALVMGSFGDGRHLIRDIVGRAKGRTP